MVELIQDLHGSSKSLVLRTPKMLYGWCYRAPEGTDLVLICAEGVNLCY
jgi:hypothetical protein